MLDNFHYVLAQDQYTLFKKHYFGLHIGYIGLTEKGRIYVDTAKAVDEIQAEVAYGVF